MMGRNDERNPNYIDRHNEKVTEQKVGMKTMAASEAWPSAVQSCSPAAPASPAGTRIL